MGFQREPGALRFNPRLIDNPLQTVVFLLWRRRHLVLENRHGARKPRGFLLLVTNQPRLFFAVHRLLFALNADLRCQAPAFHFALAPPLRF
jgi:hypothetical protein